MPKKGQSPKVCKCGEMSLPGLKRGYALCRFHFAEFMYGTQWALYVTGKAVCCLCQTPVTVHTGSFTNAPYCQPCYSK